MCGSTCDFHQVNRLLLRKACLGPLFSFICKKWTQNHNPVPSAFLVPVEDEGNGGQVSSAEKTSFAKGLLALTSFQPAFKVPAFSRDPRSAAFASGSEGAE